MNNGYQAPESAQNYIKFLESENGKIQQELLWAAISRHLSPQKEHKILDAGCGNGWLADKLFQTYPHVWGVDESEELIKHAKTNYKGPEFSIASIDENLPFDDNFFQTIILNMVAPDLYNLKSSISNLYIKLSPTGQLLMAIPNPYYAYPVAEWHRNIFDVVLGRKPKLQIKKSYHTGKIVREFNASPTGSGAKIESNFYTLPDYINTTRTAGFTLVGLEEIMSEKDDNHFNLRYQMHRYPLILLLEFAKPN